MANQSKLICQECSQEFTARQNLSRHKKKFHSIATLQFSCSTCDKIFYRKEHIVRHNLTCKGRDNLKCKICGTLFTKSSNFKRHLEICGRDKHYPCGNCGNTYRRSRSCQNRSSLHYF